MQIIFEAAGGLALFLLAMTMMTGGLKLFGGTSLKALLRDWTSTAARGVLTGALVTAIVQSSSAVTVATIGFVNAGVLNLRQALGVIFGANVGTTMTGWLVSLIGFGFRIETFALPILAIGVAMKLLVPGKRLQGLGDAITGFGLFFLGLAFLKEAFTGVAATFGAGLFAGAGGDFDLPIFLAVGFAATLLTQSSSAAIAIILTAAAEGVIGFDAAATAIIGANVGTTSTAMLAVIGATANAKRVAVGHFAFNLMTGTVALIILPGVLATTHAISAWAGLGDDPAPLLALFHTLFNLLGVALMLPLAGLLARLLERLFRTEEEDLARPRHLDRTVLATPVLALAALRQEIARLSPLVREMALAAVEAGDRPPRRIDRHAEAAFALGEVIAEFATSVRMENLPRDQAEELPHILRLSRYLSEAARLVPEAAALRQEARRLGPAAARAAVDRTLALAAIAVAPAMADDPATRPAAALARFEAAYQQAKMSLLAAAAAGSVGIQQVDAVLVLLSHCRRMVEQLSKAAHQMQADLEMQADLDNGAAPAAVSDGDHAAAGEDGLAAAERPAEPQVQRRP